MLNDWVQPLRLAIAEEFPAKPCPIALATTHLDGTPCVRMMICRRLQDTGEILLVTDERSEKTTQLRQVNAAEILFWFPARREQYRVKGTIEIVDAPSGSPLREEMWRELSDATRTTFLWPTPSTPLESQQNFQQSVPADVPPPPNFIVLQMHPTQAERLRLEPFPHDRRRWTKTNDWHEEQLNP
jgi:pyridoxamine 5'-phosphate oxidase